MSFLIVMNTCPSKAVAEDIAFNLVDSKLAACVHLQPKGLSVYRWKDKVETTEEVVLLIKTHQDKYTELQSTLQELHPYELPEIVAVPITNGSSEYFAWLNKTMEL